MCECVWIRQHTCAHTVFKLSTLEFILITFGHALSNAMCTPLGLCLLPSVIIILIFPRHRLAFGLPFHRLWLRDVISNPLSAFL